MPKKSPVHDLVPKHRPLIGPSEKIRYTDTLIYTLMVTAYTSQLGRVASVYFKREKNHDMKEFQQTNLFVCSDILSTGCLHDVIRGMVAASA